MRFLQYNDGEISLTKDLLGDNIPDYAILSHTWGADTDEVNYQDMIEGTWRNKVGYEKIRFCGEQARRDQLEYFWVDTCCINKDRHAELQYALNSMFRWYRNATRCYVYLSDVSSPPLGTNAKVTSPSWDSEFWQSRWFTRGWTLQELLAPRLVEFFSREYVRLGDKNELKEQIQEITKIPTSALQGAPLHQFSIDDRFSWMERRQTSVEVDKVYALLGILDVKIPLFEDTEAATAFKRLREVINKREKCIQDLRLTDPRDDKKRIEETKGGLLKGSYGWVVENSEFMEWRNNQEDPLLWIKGDPGKGKTMLLCGIIDELDISTFDKALLSYFFCQTTDSRINSATAVLRGLIYMLVIQQPSLASHIQKKYDHAGKALFEDANSWVALSEIFTNILKDPDLDSVYLVIDALDECVTDLPKLLNFIVQGSSITSRIKWVVSSRNWPSIEKSVNEARQKSTLWLELNEKSVSAAVAIYIQDKVDFLAKRNNYDIYTKEAVQHHLSSKANGTFLWVALVCQELTNISWWEAENISKAFPSGLGSLYKRMLDQICNSRTAELCKRILAVISVVYQPITLDELTSFTDMPPRSSDNHEALAEIIGLCGSFLTLRESTIYFVHQSARDFLIEKAAEKIFHSRIENVHYTIFSQSLRVMSKTLQRDVYKLREPGILIEQVKPPDPDALAVARYSCLYWVDHLLACNTRDNDFNDLKDDGSVHKFLCQGFLFWLEALSLMRGLSTGVISIRKLRDLVQVAESPSLYAFIHDAKRFILYFRSMIEQAPLQLYCSGLVFAPEKSIVRMTFDTCIPPWIQKKPKVDVYWNAILQTLEGHTARVTSVAFSPDGSQIVSNSYDNTIRLWDTVTGVLLQTLVGHTKGVTSVAFSPDGSEIVSNSYDNTIRLWDTVTGVLLQTLVGHTDWVASVTFSPDGRQVLSGSYDMTVRLWDAATGVLIQTLVGHTNEVTSVAFSPNGRQVVSGSDDMTVRLWDVATAMGAPLQTLESYEEVITSVAFSPDGKQVVSGSDHGIIQLWDVATATGAPLQTLGSYDEVITSVAFSPDGKQVVSGSDYGIIQLWDAATTTGAPLQIPIGHTNDVTSVAFSPDGRQVVSGSADGIMQLWDVAVDTGAPLQTFVGHTKWVNSVAFSPDGRQIVSGSDDRTVTLWDAATGAPIQTLLGHTNEVTSVAFSPDGRQVVSDSGDGMVYWDTTTGAIIQILKDENAWAILVASSPDGKVFPILCVFDHWVVEDNARIIWLPHGYWDTYSATSNRNLAIGHSSGRVSFFRIKEGAKLVI